MCYITRREPFSEGVFTNTFFESKKQQQIKDAQRTSVLMDFLAFDPSSTNQVFDQFKTLSFYIYRENPEQKSERFIYIEGWRKDKVLLVAHADTYWDSRYENVKLYIDEENHIKRIQGIGGDDRAGCAVLWLLKDLGHSLLLVDSEEIGCLGSIWLAEHNKDIMDRINSQHSFVVEFDRQGSLDYKCYNVGTDKFRSYIEEVLGFTEPNKLFASDIVYLCRDICGVNLSVGFYDEHTEIEYVNLTEWLYLAGLYEDWLSGDFSEIYRLGEKES